MALTAQRAPTSIVYDLTKLTQGRSPYRVTITHGHPGKHHAVQTHTSTLIEAAQAILADYFQDGGHWGLREAQMVARLLMTRLKTGATATITSQELSTRLLSRLLSPDSGPWIRKWSVPRSDGSGTWTVARRKDGSYGCSCPRWRFKREQCKHIAEVQDNPTSYPYIDPDEG